MSANPNRGPAQLLQFADLGMRLAVCIAGMTVGGYYLDQWLDLSPVFLITGALLGMAAGMWSVISQVEGWGKRPPPDDSTDDSVGEGTDDDA